MYIVYFINLLTLCEEEDTFNTSGRSKVYLQLFKLLRIKLEVNPLRGWYLFVAPTRGETRAIKGKSLRDYYSSILQPIPGSNRVKDI